MLTRGTCFKLLGAGAASLPALLARVPASAAAAEPRPLVLPWLVVDRVSSRECTRGAPIPAVNAEGCAVCSAPSELFRFDRALSSRSRKL